jgi:hypothetical protein
LLADAETHFANADNALKAQPPNLGLYQSEVAAAEADIMKASQLAGATPVTTTTVPGTTTVPATTTTSHP